MTARSRQGRDGSVQIGPRYKWAALAVVTYGSFWAAADVSILFIVYPELVEALHTTPSVVLWLTAAFQLVLVGLLFTLGRAGDI